MVRRPSVGVRPSFTMLKDLFSETALPIKAKFYVKPPWVGGTIFCSRHLGHIYHDIVFPLILIQLENGPNEFIFISSSDTNLLRKKSVKQK